MASQGGRRGSSTRADVAGAPADASTDEPPTAGPPTAGPPTAEAARVETGDAFARKERILGVAERLFRHYGPAKTTVAEIARACGIGVGTVYLDFASKEEILEALAAQRHEEIVERMTLAARGIEDPRERVAAMLEARTLAFLDLAERGVHACDLVRCADTIMAGRRAAGAGAAKPNAAPASFGARAREVLRHEMVQLRAQSGGAQSGGSRGGGTHAGAAGHSHDVDVAVEAIELAFVALSPPFVTRLDRERALALSRALARLLVFGV